MTNKKRTPMMEQYFELKEKYKDCLLFYRLGDFYELFYDDAKIAAPLLGLVLTNRSNKTKNKDDTDEVIPMCGVPFHACDNYLVRLVKAGHKVAICEQTEDPEEARKRGTGSVVKRDVIRVVTAGTLIEDSLLEANRNNYLMVIVPSSLSFGVAWADISTGFFQTQMCSNTDLYSVVSRIGPAEIVLEEGFQEKYPGLLTLFDDRYTYQDNRIFHKIANKQEAFTCFPSIADGSFDDLEVQAIGALIMYVKSRQMANTTAFQVPNSLNTNLYMEIDASTRKSLELISSLADNKDETSVLKSIDATKTTMGGRLLAQQLSLPLMDLALINERLDKIAFFVDNPIEREKCRNILKQLPDFERILGRVFTSKSMPSEILAFGQGLQILPKLNELLASISVPDALEQDRIALGTAYYGLATQIIETIIPEDTPGNLKNPGFIRAGFSAQLDELRGLQENSKKFIGELQQKYCDMTGIASLKIKYNNLIGYHIEVNAKYAEDIASREDNIFILRQSLVNASRYTTIELTELENKIMHAGEELFALELEIYDALLNDIKALHKNLILTFAAIARIDVATALAENADTYHWCRPNLTTDLSFEIKAGRHPVVEKALQKEKVSFVPNDCIMDYDTERLWILTGPNMAGKSTFLRQNAVIAIMAQIGSFVPAESATIGLVDRVFSRVGASDDLARGRSTFMVEMVEVATILNEATDKSLVILDEVGRGTATFDGLSIAWAVVEYLHDINKCRALFATHYHELTALTNRLNAVSLYTMRVKEWQGDIVFMHEVCQGAIDRSYGIHVGKLAGLPKSVSRRAEQILAQLEEKKQDQKPLFDDLPLFAQIAKETQEKEPTQLEKTIRSVNVDNLTPREALEYLYELKKIAEEE